ncbi:MAG: hypothetical protein HOK72_13085 [Flavobacteriales bacterium]|jgi:hypothetical protein|nr:hypothetical protein [Rickettsiales bacterium]MBT6440635.1 hypothetical protein [Flavobacteriales bacterium]
MSLQSRISDLGFKICHTGRPAFSLLELALVLVISSLTIVGFLKGQELLGYARLYKVTKEIQTYRAAIATYHIAYDYYPGDDPNATSNLTTVADGNGDDYIDWSDESYNADLAIIETGLMQLPLNGVYRVSAFKDSLYHPPTTCNNLNNADIGTNCHQLGSPLEANSAGLTPREHYHIDRKLDDSIPVTGKIRFRVISDVTLLSCGDSDGYFLSSNQLGCNLTYDITID